MRIQVHPDRGRSCLRCRALSLRPGLRPGTWNSLLRRPSACTLSSGGNVQSTHRASCNQNWGAFQHWHGTAAENLSSGGRCQLHRSGNMTERNVGRHLLGKRRSASVKRDIAPIDERGCFNRRFLSQNPKGCFISDIRNFSGKALT